MMRKIRKSLLAIMLAVFCVLGLSSCVENENYEQYQPQQGSMFVCVESYTDPYLGDVKILFDRKTRIMYIRYYVSEGDGTYSGITVLYDSNGNPKKYMGGITD